MTVVESVVRSNVFYELRIKSKIYCTDSTTDTLSSVLLFINVVKIQ